MKLTAILNKSKLGIDLSYDEILFLLNRESKAEIERILETARFVRDKYFGNKIFMYGFVYFSNHCKNLCSFCLYRNGNNMVERYRKTTDEIVKTAVELKNSGVHLIDLTMGEDEYFLNNPEILVDIVKKVKDATSLPVMVSCGVVENKILDKFKEVGADWYALYQETNNRKLFKSLRVDQDYDSRYNAKKYADKIGLLVEEGMLAGVGNSKEDSAKFILEMKVLNASQVRAMTFIPQSGTPLSKIKQSSFIDEILLIAVMRLVHKNVLIPASLDVDGLNGLEDRLNAGANVITSIIPPKEGYMGVANSSYDIDNGTRTIEGTKATLMKLGLEKADLSEYENYIEERKGGFLNENSSCWC